MERANEEQALIAAARGGDREAFCALVAAHQEVAFRAAWLVLRDAAAAEDAAQDAFLRAYQHLGRFRAGEPFRPWLLRIVTNLALNQVRAGQRRQGLLGRFARMPVASAPPADEGALAGERRGELATAINDLSADDRLVLYLRYFLDLSEREIATVIDRPPGTVKSRLSRACGRLRDVIERRYPTLRPEWMTQEAGDD